MADFIATIELTIDFTAKDQAQAEERAAEIETNIEFDKKFHPRWLGDLDFTALNVESND